MASTTVTCPAPPNGALTSAPIPIDLRRYSSGVGLLLTISGTLTSATVQVTGDNIETQGYNPATGHWNSHDTLFLQTQSANGSLAFPVTAVRLVVVGPVGNASATLAVVQVDV